MGMTPNLALPYIFAAQAQKHVTHNEAIRALDALVQMAVADRDLAAPPAAPADGVRYLVAAAASGAWAGREHSVAAWQDGAWAFYAPQAGWMAWVVDEAQLLAWDGAAWVAAGGGTVNPTPLVGVSAVADAGNRLAVASPASLFNHQGADHRLKINKAAAGDTAAVLYQTGFSGRAETGLAGDDDWHLKVSPDGTTWREALVVDRATGAVTLPNTPAPSAGGSGLARYLTNRKPESLRKFLNQLTRLHRFGERLRVNLYGDSLTLGGGSIRQQFAPGQVLADELARRGIRASCNLFGMSFPDAAALTAFEPRITFSGTWGSWDQVQSTSALRCTSPGGTMTYAPGIPFDRASLFYVQQTSGLGAGGSMTIVVDGGATQFSTPGSGGFVSSQTISQAGGFSVVEVEITITGPPAAHSITVTNGSSGNIEIYGIEPYTAGVGEVLIRSCAGSSLTSTDLVYGSRLVSTWQLPCELYILGIGRNDCSNGVPVATYQANLQTLEDNMRVLSIADIVYWTPPPAAISVTSLASQQAYVDAMKTQAATDVMVVDMWQRIRDRGGYEAYTQSGGWYNDTVHPAVMGSRDIAITLADALLWRDE